MRQTDAQNALLVITQKGRRAGNVLGCGEPVTSAVQNRKVLAIFVGEESLNFGSV